MGYVRAVGRLYLEYAVACTSKYAFVGAAKHAVVGAGCVSDSSGCVMGTVWCHGECLVLSLTVAFASLKSFGCSHDKSRCVIWYM